MHLNCVCVCVCVHVRVHNTVLVHMHASMVLSLVQHDVTLLLKDVNILHAEEDLMIFIY